jgi:hypothetical protein
MINVYFYTNKAAMRFETSSAKDALIFNGKGSHVVNPWRIIIDTDAEIISVKKRNWHMIGTDDQTVAFKRIRSITIDEHFVGADIHIKVVGGSISVYCLSKSDARKIKEILLAYNEQGGGNTLTIV